MKTKTGMQCWECQSMKGGIGHENHNKPQHTTTPWVYKPQYGSNVIYKGVTSPRNGPHQSIGITLKDEDAAFIVRAVNCHDGLLESLRECVHLLGESVNYEKDKDFQLAVDCAYDIIAKAEGKI